MRRIILWIIAFFCLSCLVVPVAPLSDEEQIFKEIQNISVTVPPTGTAVLGSKESMTEYGQWLNNIAVALMNYANAVLRVFGQKDLHWTEENLPQGPVTPSVINPIPAVSVTAPPIRQSPDLDTVQTISGGSGTRTVSVNVPSGYWELWYTVDPIVTGAQDSHSATGSQSAVFPTFSIKVTDAKTSQEIETVEPPGGLDKTLWARAGDPRPWSKRFFKGGREFQFEITARHVKSYVIEVRIPKS
ncbi:MAG: hypothetical protein A4E35_02208 [Methanoregula sp. PtaU1.Bin051]|nr:MAG: hypothetical protein A4E35_02208 [Methanoregula sp. PtaU1.Bin051]